MTRACQGLKGLAQAFARNYVAVASQPVSHRLLKENFEYPNTCGFGVV